MGFDLPSVNQGDADVIVYERSLLLASIVST